MLFEIADGGGVVYWQKLILCCSTGGLQAVADKMNQAGGDVTNIIEQALLPALAALRRRHKPHLPAGGVVEKRGDAGRCEDVRCGDVAAADDWLQAKLTQRCGMGTCQGRTCAASARWLYGWPLPQPREPLSPARAETLIALARLNAEP